MAAQAIQQRLGELFTPVQQHIGKAANATGLNTAMNKMSEVAGGVSAQYALLDDMYKEGIETGVGLVMIKAGAHAYQLTKSEGPDLDCASQILDQCKSLGSRLAELKSLHTAYDTARSEHEKVVGGEKESPKPQVAEEKMKNAQGHFERRLDAFSNAVAKAHEGIEKSHERRTTELTFPVGTKNQDLYAYWGEMKDALVIWVDDAKKQCTSEYAAVDFASVTKLVSDEDGGKAHVLGKAADTFRNAHSSAERRSPFHRNSVRLGVKFASALSVTGGAYLVATRGVQGLCGRAFSCIKSYI